MKPTQRQLLIWLSGKKMLYQDIGNKLNKVKLKVMSTTFGVDIDGNNDIRDVVEVAFRSNGIRFTNKIAHLLPDDTSVIALDNS